MSIKITVPMEGESTKCGKVPGRPLDDLRADAVLTADYVGEVAGRVVERVGELVGFIPITDQTSPPTPTDIVGYCAECLAQIRAAVELIDDEVGRI